MTTDPAQRCWICDQPIRLEDCKIDEHGRAVHETCYVAKVSLENKSAQDKDKPKPKP